MQPTEKGSLNNQRITVTDRKRIEIDGVTAILGFEEDYARLETNMGNLLIEGENIKIENLAKDSCKILLTGSFYLLEFENSYEKKKKGKRK